MKSRPAKRIKRPQIIAGSGLELSTNGAIAGDTLEISWTGLVSPHPNDWIGLVRPVAVGAFDSHYAYIDRYNTDSRFGYFLDGSTNNNAPDPTPPTETPASSGSLFFKLPSYLPDGTYSFRLWRYVAADEYWFGTTNSLTSENLSVTNAAPTLTLDGGTSASKTAGSSVTVAWALASNEHVLTTNWFALFRERAAPQASNRNDTSGPNRPPWLEWWYADGTKNDAGTAAPRGQQSGSFSFVIPAALIAGRYTIWMLKSETAGGSTPNTKWRALARTGVLTVTGNSYPADLAFVGPSNTPDILDTDFTSDSALETGQVGTAYPWAIAGPHEYSNDGTLNFMRASTFDQAQFFLAYHNRTGNLTEVYYRICVWFEDSYLDGFNEFGCKMPCGIRGNASIQGYPGDQVDWATRAHHGELQAGGTFRLQDYRTDHNGQQNDTHVTSAYLQPNRWYSIEFRVRLNTVGLANGIEQIWVNGNLVGDRSDIEWTIQSDSHFFRDSVEQYHGGTLNYPCPPGYMRVAKWALSTSYIGPPAELV
jgi:hypothetical protein